MLFNVVADYLAVGKTDVSEFHAHFAGTVFSFLDMDYTCIGTDYDDRIGEEKGEAQQFPGVKSSAGTKAHAAFAQIDYRTDFGDLGLRGIKRRGVYLHRDIRFNTGKISAFMTVHGPDCTIDVVIMAMADAPEEENPETVPFPGFP